MQLTRMSVANMASRLVLGVAPRATSVLPSTAARLQADSTAFTRMGSMARYSAAEPAPATHSESGARYFTDYGVYK